MTNTRKNSSKKSFQLFDIITTFGMHFSFDVLCNLIKNSSGKSVNEAKELHNLFVCPVRGKKTSEI